jgi:hypothetical protein
VNDPVNTQRPSNRGDCCDLSHRDAGPLELGCDRRPAASAGPSSRSQDDRIDRCILQPLGHLAA